MSKKIYKICLAVITAICMITGVCLYIFLPPEKEDNYSQEEVCDIQEFKHIAIEAANMDVEIKAGESYKVSYRCTGSKEPTITLNGNVLRIYQEDVGADNKCKVNIVIPSNKLIVQTTIKLITGNISISYIENSDIKAEVNLGNISITECATINADLTTNVGNINIAGDGIQSVTANTSVGDIDMQTREDNYSRNVFLSSRDGKIYFYNKISSNKLSVSPVTFKNDASLYTIIGNIYYNNK